MPLDARRFATRLVAGAPGTWWEQARLGRAMAGDHLDVWFSPGYSAPLLSRVPTVVAVHDVSFAAHPEWFRAVEGMRRRWVVRQSAERACSVITISEFSRSEVVQHLRIADAKIRVIPPGVRLATQSPRPLTLSPQPSLSPPPSTLSPSRVLYVGSIFNRRHIIDLIRAFGTIARTRRNVSLDLVGDNRTYPYEDLRRTIANEGLEDHARWHEYVSDAQLRDLYAGARAFAFLSEYEGLGLTPLEALAAGVPPVLLDTPVARESCGDAAWYVPANDLPAIARGLDALLFDEAARAQILAAAPEQLGRYSWPRAARDTLAVLESCSSSESGRSR